MRYSFRLVMATALAAAINPASTNAQSSSGRDRWADSARVLIESGVRKGDAGEVDAARTLLDRALTAFPNDALLLHYQGYALYRKATMSLGRKTGVDPRPMLEDARAALEKSGKVMPLPETFALQSAVIGQQIAHSKNPLSGMTLGPKSSDAITRAVAEGPRNPRVWLMRGIGAMFTPEMWGGGLDKAEGFLKQSVAYFEADNPARPLPAWGRAEAYIWLGQIYAKRGKSDAARAAFESAVKLEPDNGWARALLAAPSAATALK